MAGFDMGGPRASAPRRDWVSKTLAGLLMGGVLSLGASGFLVLALGSLPLPVRGQLAMWLVPPLWLGVLCSVYFFASGPRAWLWLGGASVLMIATNLGLRLL